MRSLTHTAGTPPMNRRYVEELKRREMRQYRPMHNDYPQQRDRGGSGYDVGRGGWDWSDQVWSGQELDEGMVQGRYDYGTGRNAQLGYGRAKYRPGGYGSRHREGSSVHGQDQYGWTEYDQPRYVGSIYRGERRGEEPYREHEWQRSKEPPHFLERVYTRGPKGYTRSDERVEEDVSEQLWRAEYIDSSDVSVVVKSGVVMLSGTVPERWMRYEIENIADNCMGVRDIENNVRVRPRTSQQMDVVASGTPGTEAGRA